MKETFNPEGGEIKGPFAENLSKAIKEHEEKKKTQEATPNEDLLRSEKLSQATEVEKASEVAQPEEKPESPKESPAEKMERLTANLDAEDVVIKKEVEQKGYGEAIKSFGKMYQKMPLKHKLLISGGLIATASIAGALGGAAGTAIAAAAFTGSIGQRMLGGLATFVALEGVLKKQAEAKGEEVSKRSIFLAGTLGGLVGTSSLLSSALDSITGALGGETVEAAAPVEESVFGEGEAPEIQLPGTAGDISSTPDRMTMPTTEIRAEAPVSTPDRITMPVTEITAEAPTPDRITMPTTEIRGSAFVEDYVVQQGDNIWGILASEPAFTELSEGQKTYALDMLKDKLAGLSPDQLREIGISSGNINQLNAGEAINLASVLSTDEIMNAANTASGLSEASLHSIQENNSVIAEWVKAHPDTLLTDALITDILEEGETVEAPAPIADTGIAPEALSTEMTPEMIAETNHIIKEDLNSLFGTTGAFGLFSEAGSDSLAWAGLKGETVEAVLGKQEFGENYIQDTNADEAISPSGIDSPEDTRAMQDYLTNVINQTGVAPRTGETVEAFIQRAVGTSVQAGQ